MGQKVSNPRPELQISVDRSPLAADVKANFPSSFVQYLGKVLPMALLRKGYDAAGLADARGLKLKVPVVEEEILMPVAAEHPPTPAYPHLRSWLYQPASLKESKAESPLIVFWHGGGFCLGSAGNGSHHSICRFLAAETGFRLVSLDYRMSPEVKYPVPLRDAFAGYTFVCQHPERFGLPADASKAKVILTGDSAGAVLSIATMLAIRNHNRKLLAESTAAASGGAGSMPTPVPLIKPTFVLPFYPAADRRASTPMRDSACQYFSGYTLTVPMVHGFMQIFFGDDQEQARLETDPEAHLILQDDFSDLPEILLLACECDMLRDEGKAFYEHAKAKGANISYTQADGLPHGFLTQLSSWTTAKAKAEEFAKLMVEKCSS